MKMNESVIADLKSYLYRCSAGLKDSCGGKAKKTVGKTAEAKMSSPAQITKTWGEFTSSREREIKYVMLCVCDNGREVEKEGVR